jgi:transcriptional accessory protein Tex/SPT6
MYKNNFEDFIEYLSNLHLTLYVDSITDDCKNEYRVQDDVQYPVRLLGFCDPKIPIHIDVFRDDKKAIVSLTVEPSERQIVIEESSPAYTIRDGSNRAIGQEKYIHQTFLPGFSKSFSVQKDRTITAESYNDVKKNIIAICKKELEKNVNAISMITRKSSWQLKGQNATLKIS